MRNDASPRLSDTKMNSPCNVFDKSILPSAHTTSVNKSDVLIPTCVKLSGLVFKILLSSGNMANFASYFHSLKLNKTQLTQVHKG